MPGDHPKSGGLASPLAAAFAFAIVAALAYRRQTIAGRAADAAEEGDRSPPAQSLHQRLSTAGRRGRSVALMVYNRINEHRVFSVAAGVAFYSLLAIFPAIAALVSLYGLFANPNVIATDLQQLSGILPAGAMDVVKDQLTRVALQQHGTLGLTFLVSLVVSLWSANSGVKALIDALNVVHGEIEQRNFLKLNALGLAFTSAAILFASLAIGALVVLPIVLHSIGMDAAIPKLLPALRWPALFVPMALGLSFVYRYGPCCSRPKWRWVSFGSVGATVIWLAASSLFSGYTARFDSYNNTYGSLGAVIGFMTWLWISFIVILLGAELDSAIAVEAGEAKRVAKREAKRVFETP